jgi:hypothetical protein
VDGSGVFLGNAFEPVFENVTTTMKGRCGLEGVRSANTYTVQAQGCLFQGTESAASLFGAILNFTGVNFQGGGITTLRLTGCQGVMTAPMFGPGFGGSQEYAVSLIGDSQGGGNLVMVNPEFDSENTAFTRGVFWLENSRFGLALKIDLGGVGLLNGGLNVFDLSLTSTNQVFLQTTFFRATTGHTADNNAISIKGNASALRGTLDCRDWGFASVDPAGVAPPAGQFTILS